LGVAVAVVIGPHNSRAETVGLGYDGVLRDDEPLPINSHTIVPILGIPVHILHAKAVGKRTAQALPARETVEPRLERRIRKSTVVTCIQLVRNECRQVKGQSCEIDESAHRDRVSNSKQSECQSGHLSMGGHLVEVWRNG